MPAVKTPPGLPNCGCQMVFIRAANCEIDADRRERLLHTNQSTCRRPRLPGKEAKIEEREKKSTGECSLRNSTDDCSVPNPVDALRRPNGSRLRTEASGSSTGNDNEWRCCRLASEPRELPRACVVRHGLCSCWLSVDGGASSP